MADHPVMNNGRPVTFNGGQVLTEEMIAAALAEAEAGPDLSSARRFDVRSGRFLTPGRPAGGGGRGESPRLAFRVPADLHARAKARAKDEGLTLSLVMQNLLAEWARGALSAPDQSKPRTKPAAKPAKKTAHAKR